eukprot:TRINITY_DN27423_c0_g1_i1.p1 TRINITY_DN27423_c0_g1~~TRINITY_DN27423_c0_g1_i1.p1  ORF type:complete len:650 (+),score=143.35 TRINITY_DN27423_c0_g1_i1:49-1998(+)
MDGKSQNRRVRFERLAETTIPDQEPKLHQDAAVTNSTKSPAERAFTEHLKDDKIYKELLYSLSVQSRISQTDLHCILEPLRDLFWIRASNPTDGKLVDNLQAEVESLKQKLLEGNLAAVKEIARLKGLDEEWEQYEFEKDSVQFYEALSYLDEVTRELVLWIIREKVRQMASGILPPELQKMFEESERKMKEMELAAAEQERRMAELEESISRSMKREQDLRLELVQTTEKLRATTQELERTQNELEAEKEVTSALREEVLEEKRRALELQEKLDRAEDEIQQRKAQEELLKGKLEEAIRGPPKTTLCLQTQMTMTDIQSLETEVDELRECVASTVCSQCAAARRPKPRPAPTPLETPSLKLKNVFARLWDDVGRREKILAEVELLREAEENGDGDTSDAASTLSIGGALEEMLAAVGMTLQEASAVLGGFTPSTPSAAMSPKRRQAALVSSGSQTDMGAFVKRLAVCSHAGCQTDHVVTFSQPFDESSSEDEADRPNVLVKGQITAVRGFLQNRNRRVAFNQAQSEEPSLAPSRGTVKSNLGDSEWDVDDSPKASGHLSKDDESSKASRSRRGRLRGSTSLPTLPTLRRKENVAVISALAVAQTQKLDLGLSTIPPRWKKHTRGQTISQDSLEPETGQSADRMEVVLE